MNILLDTKTSLTDTQGIFNSFESKYKLANHRHIGTYTNVKGIIVIYNKNKTTIRNTTIIKEGQILNFEIKINAEWINVVAIYAPPERDDPNFFLEAKAALDSMEGDNGILLGDYNTTIDPDKDRHAYIGDSHKKCRTVLQTWESTEELSDCYRFFFPDTKCFTFRQKKR